MSDLSYLKAKCSQYGNYFFDPASMSFWDSEVNHIVKVSPNDYRVITSERDYPDKRRYTVRNFHIDNAKGKVKDTNVSGFMEYDSVHTALSHIKDGL